MLLGTLRMGKIKDFFSRHSLVSELLTSWIPEFARVDLYFKERKKILDQPRVVLGSKIKSPLAYASFCLIAPIGAVFLIILPSLQAIGVVGSSSIEHSIADMRDLDARSVATLDRIEDICRRNGDNSIEFIAYCKARLRSQIANGRSDIQSMLEMLEYSQRLSYFVQSKVFIIQSAVLIINAYFFAIVWARLYPMHAAPDPGDRAIIRKAYLLSLGTTAFIPSIFAAIAMMVSE